MSNEVKKYEVGECWVIGSYSDMLEDGDGRWVRASDYAALEAECELWKERCQYNADTAHAVATERDALHTQLEAIRAAGGEAVAWLSDKHAFAEKLYAAGWRDHADAQHTGCDELRQEFQRIVAAMAAELATERARADAAVGDANEAERELAAIKAQEPVATVEQREPYADGTPHPGRSLRWSGNNAEDDLPVGATLYMLPPLAGQVSGQEWVPVSERLPDHGAPVLVAYKFGGVYTCRRSVIDHDLAADEPMHGERDRPTHWMQLPAAPALLATPSMEVKHGD